MSNSRYLTLLIWYFNIFIKLLQPPKAITRFYTLPCEFGKIGQLSTKSLGMAI